MDKRTQFIEYVKHGGEPICSPQIGAGAGFDTKLAGKEWISQTTLEDTLAGLEQFDIVPLVNIGASDLGECDSRLRWKEVSCERSGDRIVTQQSLETPAGTLLRKVVEEKKKGAFCEKSPVRDADDLDALEYYVDVALESDNLSSVTTHVSNAVSTIAGNAALSIQWATQPYEMLCFPDTVTTVMLAYDRPEQFRRLMDKILLLDERLMSAVALGGADFIFLGGPASEMISPDYYERYIIPYSQKVSSIAHSLGLLVYSHICSPIEPFLSMGFYNRMGIDLFETLSPPPVGNVASLADALRKIDPGICTRGNIGLDALLNSSPAQIRDRTLEMLDAAQGRKHIIAASDYLFYDVSACNVAAMADAVRECRGG